MSGIFEEGQAVRIVVDLKNDGTMPNKGPGEVLQIKGDLGFVIGTGSFLDELVYQVHFLEKDQIVGCREKELIDAEDPWSPPLFETGAKVLAANDLYLNGALLAAQGTQGQITIMRYRPDLGYVYEVKWEGQELYCLLKEAQLLAGK
ncbi:MAG: hypothetical protein A2527_01465 [Candidatus Lambdaproteobacteria bacterium RIFOXYD2_FULL_50_16]|uniref:Nitrogen fixation protein NifZ n=1 Tax=Candidatus Lambdaproteobacteria bacterium RIFOXYD2_FULL_50_16 TaxID=1817772 RepID=A0A1F6G8T1_9PROT|nr:MAG: hypothetical protein A2527_01465 [Candidatus Lambdaproteobacteria bacterium RIFOXYD2_FULL_50_16]